eukprot:NODE_796_length_4178_cov_0.311351.p2 type:complete len:101 gc:universal NODE_796_length_4178_cov_0.311351:1394-1092(-)
MTQKMQFLKLYLIQCSDSGDERVKIVPQRGLGEGSVFYYIHCTMQYHPPFMIYMMKEVEERVPTAKRDHPKHFRLDTASLVYFLFTNENEKKSDYTAKKL